MVFEKPSARTRSSVELAIAEFGGHPANLATPEMQLGWGETVPDTAGALACCYDALVDRAFRSQNEEALARRSSVPAIKAHDDHEDPGEIVAEPQAAAREADAVGPDVWISMGEESEASERARAFAGFTIDDALRDVARPGAFALRDLPAYRGLETTDAGIDGDRHAIWDRAENRLHAQTALLEFLLSPRRPGADRSDIA